VTRKKKELSKPTRSCVRGRGGMKVRGPTPPDKAWQDGIGTKKQARKGKTFIWA